MSEDEQRIMTTFGMLTTVKELEAKLEEVRNLLVDLTDMGETVQQMKSSSEAEGGKQVGGKGHGALRGGEGLTMYVAEQDPVTLTCNRCSYAVLWCATPRLLMCQRTGRIKRPPCDYTRKLAYTWSNFLPQNKGKGRLNMTGAPAFRLLDLAQKAKNYVLRKAFNSFPPSKRGQTGTISAKSLRKGHALKEGRNLAARTLRGLKRFAQSHPTGIFCYVRR